MMYTVNPLCFSNLQGHSTYHFKKIGYASMHIQLSAVVFLEGACCTSIGSWISILPQGFAQLRCWSSQGLHRRHCGNTRHELTPRTMSSKKGRIVWDIKKGKLSSSTCQQQTSSQPEIWWAITALHGFSNLLPTIWQDLKAHSFPSFAKHLAGEMNAVHLAALSSGISFGCLSDNLCVAGHRNIWKWVRPNGRVPWVHCLGCSGLLQQKSAQNRHVKDGFFVVGKLKSMLVGTLTTLHFTSTLQRIRISILPCMTGHHQPDMLWKSDDGLK